MLKRFREEELLGKALTEKQKREIARAQIARDEDIDTSHIPETRELPVGAVRGETFQPFPRAVDVKAIRARTGLSQAEFAKRYRFNVRTAGLNRRARYVPTSP
jgi:hypothetical protein